MSKSKIGNLPILFETEYILFGGSFKEVKESLRLAGEQKQVLLATSGFYPATDIFDSFSYQINEETDLFFPKEAKEGLLLKPDEGKKYLEKICISFKVQLLYGVVYLDCIEQDEMKFARFASKSGVFYVKCKKIFLEEKIKSAREWKYTILMQREQNSHFELMTVSEEVKKKDEKNVDILYRLQKKALDTFLQRKRRDDSLVLGRFAPLMRPDTDEQHIIEWISKENIAANEKLVTFQTGNGLKNTEITQIYSKQKECDLVVAGGGTSGALAALHAARMGLNVVLIEQQYVLGGTSTVGGVSTYWFGNRYEDVKEINNITDKYMEEFRIQRRQGIWSDNDDFHPGIRGFVLQKLCLEAGVKIHYGQVCIGAICTEEKNEKRITGIVTAGDEGKITFYAKAYLDATGDGDVAVFAGADSVYGSERDAITYWASLAQYTGISTYRNNFSTMVIEADQADVTRFVIQARKIGEDIFDHGRYLSMRESRHIRTKRRLDLKDLIGFQTYQDALYTCYSNYDPKGKLDADCVYCGFLPPQTQIQIPLSSLIPCAKDGRQIRGIYVLGKAIGATHNIFPSIRMQPDLMHQGAVMGKLVALSLQRGTLPEQLSNEERKELLMQISGDELQLPNPQTDVKKAVKRLSPDSRTHWVDVPFTYREEKMEDSLVVLLADDKQAVQYLLQRLKKEKSPQMRQLLIGFCIWHGEYGDTAEYAERIKEELRAGVLPKRKASTMCAQLLPDHGVMPEIVYQLNLLGRSGKKEIIPLYKLVLDLLMKDERDYQRIEDGIYHYVETFAYAAEHSTHKEWIPLLHKLLELQELKNLKPEKEENSIVTERLWILKLILCRSLVRLCDETGKKELKKMEKCPCMAIRLSAERALKEFGAGARTEKIW